MLTNTIKEFFDTQSGSIRSLSQKAGLSHATLYRYIKNPNEIPSHISLKQLCEYFNEPPSAFIHFEPRV